LRPPITKRQPKSPRDHFPCDSVVVPVAATDGRGSRRLADPVLLMMARFRVKLSARTAVAVKSNDFTSEGGISSPFPHVPTELGRGSPRRFVPLGLGKARSPDGVGVECPKRTQPSTMGVRPQFHTAHRIGREFDRRLVRFPRPRLPHSSPGWRLASIESASYPVGPFPGGGPTRTFTFPPGRASSLLTCSPASTGAAMHGGHCLTTA